MARILVSGSLAYDRIMDFPGLFEEHLIAEKMHALSVSFYVESLKESFGGTAGNIAYSLSLFGEEPLILGTAGNDFELYRQWLTKHSIPAESIEIADDIKTAFATIITDRKDNQISAFYAGAMARVYDKELPIAQYGIIGAGNPDDMRTMPGKFRTRGVPYLFDPGQGIPVLSETDLKNGIEGSAVVISNDYELGMMIKKTLWDEKEMLEHTKMIVTTLGEKGSRVTTKEGVIAIPAAKPESAIDPTGAGDAYRAGFIAGMVRGLTPEVCAKLGAVASCYTVEREGTQTHTFTKDAIARRYEQNFSETITL